MLCLQISIVFVLASSTVGQYPAPRGYNNGHNDHCSIETLEKYAQVCTPTLLQECEKETTRDGPRVETREECYKITKTICHEDEEIENNEVCAYYYEDRPVEAEVKTVSAVFITECKDEEVCMDEGVGYDKCHNKEYRHVCQKIPILKPVIKKVTLQLPYPVEKCINTPIHLPRLQCKEVHERGCLLNPKLQDGEIITTTKCNVKIGNLACSDTVMQLPRQACPSKITNVKNIYEYIEETDFKPGFYPAGTAFAAGGYSG